jgi:hypothetical protein
VNASSSTFAPQTFGDGVQWFLFSVIYLIGKLDTSVPAVLNMLLDWLYAACV